MCIISTLDYPESAATHIGNILLDRIFTPLSNDTVPKCRYRLMNIENEIEEILDEHSRLLPRSHVPATPMPTQTLAQPPAQASVQVIEAEGCCTVL